MSDGIKKNRQGGFTLFEALIAIAFMAALMAIGIPSLRQLLSESRASSAATDIMADIYVARSSAAKLMCPVEIVPLSGSQDWTSGWVVRYVAMDLGADDARCDPTGAGDEVILKRRDPIKDLRVFGPSDRLIYDFDGRARNGDIPLDLDRDGTVDIMGGFAVVPRLASDMAKMRCVTVTPSGKPREVKDGDQDIGNGC